MLIWTSGIVLASLKIIIGKIGLLHLTKQAHRTRLEKYSSVVKQLSNILGIHREIVLITSSNCKLPFTCRVFKPIIVFPSDMVYWSKKRVQIVLLHELAHIRRMDFLTQLIARITCTFFWFVPPVWIAYTNLYLEQEQACDELVIKGGTKPTEYASHVVNIARRIKGHILLAGLFIARGRKKILEKRVTNVLKHRDFTEKVKGGIEMKTRNVLLIIVLFLVFVILVASCATGKKAYVTKDFVLKELTGTWVNEDYNEPSLMASAKVIVEHDGSYLLFKYTQETNAATANKGKFFLEEMWTDPKGNIWYKARLEEDWAEFLDELLYEMGKISNHGNDWELVWSSVEYPDEIDPNNANYRIHYRQ
jgi:beta-lactamase regulating signal transducer with metallopeptidase domain